MGGLEEEIMSLYEYECPKGHRFEMKRPMEDRHKLVRCEKCRGIARLVISIVNHKQVI